MDKINLNTLYKAYDRLMDITLNQISITGLEELIHPDLFGWGTTLAEEVYSIEGFVNLVRNQETSAKEHQLEFVFNREKVFEHFSESQDTAVFLERIKVTIEAEELLNEFMFRFSAVMTLHEGNWKLIHWHGSVPADIEDDVWHVEEWKREKEKLEKQVEERTRELKEAQDQLIQQEKLASLGQLTAGIAHEIKNPLNFINNFSELSIELIEELKQAIENNNSDEIADISSDIQQNLSKIHEHGNRADSIVKSMLQHSRTGNGDLIPTDLNALIKEYVNLAFHGMRAGKDPINVDLKFDLDESIGKIPVVPDDFSRVIVNLSNNSFDAMRDKLRAAKTADYTPVLSIRTFLEESAVVIEVRDNGPGIPKEIRDKIMQPFFTTKKGTEGTGLGLSITHDIIKAHAGSLSITESGEQGTAFRIILGGVNE